MAADPSLWRPLLEAPFFGDLERAIIAGRGLELAGVVEGARSLLLTLLMARTDRRLLLVVPDDATVDTYRRDLSAFAVLAGRDPGRILVLPALEADPYDALAPHPEVVRERVVALGRLGRDEVDVLLVPARALLSPLLAPETWVGFAQKVSVGDLLSPESFVLRAMSLGYRRVDIVSAPGEVSRRGGILDVFPPDAPEPVRIELFGDTVESLRAFDTDHQRSTGQLEEVVIGAASENPATDDAVRRLAAYLETGPAEGDATRLRQHRRLFETLEQEGSWPGFEALTALTTERPATLFEHAARLTLVLDEPELTAAGLESAIADFEASHAGSGDRVLPAPRDLFVSPDGIAERLAGAGLTLRELAGAEAGAGRETIQVACRSARAYAGRIGELAVDLHASAERAVRTVCVMRAAGSAERLVEILAEYDLPPAHRIDGGATAGDTFGPGGLFVSVGGLRKGFEFPEAGLSVLAERDVYGEERKVADRRAGPRGVFVSDFRDLKTGGLVVHVDHGVAHYRGLGRPKGGSLNRDFMVLEFAQRDRLFVPVDRLDLVQKYNGTAGSRPALDRLGGPGWERVKARVRKSVESMARELLELYARRKAARGHAFGEDLPWQGELESAFPYELTPDQQRAVEEIKRDMQSERTADRLLVGDVGFGKTEVAVRAAFKAILEGFQAAVLTPTTVLAMQHFRTFRERYAPFPVRVEMVSRFRSVAENRKVLADVAVGAVDLVIGTHRLLSKDVQFKKLGLLVVDEEQRFGVAHKERLKRMSIGVDVLSMTATPIPRTLQMSLAGVRDLSVIETPPPGRMAIQTSIVPFRKNVLAQAMRQELRRGGQVFVVHNRVSTLPALAHAAREMVPDARVEIAHGQMPERKLEAVMMRFLNHEADILVTTTIIENGLDIPRANTIVVNRADRFGLAQLYQLRGRVGRSHEHAYAYFVVPSREGLSSDARKRLLALQEFSELGAGFRLAAADLEIRGAGELLGNKQHGHIASLGFDLYCQMLERAVGELQGEPAAERRPASLHVGVDIKIPETFLPESADRLVVYKRLAQASTTAEIDRLQSETEDRFGHLPPPARNLFEMGRLRLVAEIAGVKSIDLVEDKLQMRFHDRPAVETQRVLELIARERGTLTPSGMAVLPAPERGADRIRAVRGVLERLLGRPATVSSFPGSPRRGG